MNRLALLLVSVLGLSLSTTTARAESICMTGSPGSEECAVSEQPSSETSEELAPHEKRLERRIAERTHDFIMPNGSLTPRGRLGVRVHGFGLLNTLSYGINDHVEISATAPAIPFITSMGVRVGLTKPDSRFRLTLGGHVIVPLIQDEDEDFYYITQPSATVAYRSGSFEVHATLSAFIERTDELLMPMGNVGVSVRTGKRTLLHFNYASINHNRFDPSDTPRKNVAIAGMKYMATNWDIDFGLVAGGAENEMLMFPFISLNRVY